MKILMVCLGNICRSPLAEGILRHKTKQLDIEVDSAGTAAYHIGELPDKRSIEIANEAATKMLGELASGKAMSELSDLYQLELKEFDELKRNADTLPRGLMDAVFATLKTNIDNNHYSTVTMDENVYLFEVLQLNPGRLDDFNDQERDSGKIALAEQLGSNELASFAKQLRENAVVEVNPKLFSDAYDL